jgi:flagellar FliJ protein
MAFRFPLATVLRLREIAEDREERLLGQILQQITQARQVLADLQERHAALLKSREAALNQQMTGVELLDSYSCMRTIEDMQRLGQQQMVRLEALKAKQLRTYEEAHRNRELLSDMRKQKYEIYEQERGRKEQAVQDDNFSARMSLR